MKREDLYTDPDFIIEGIQLDLYNKLVEYMELKGLNQTELAKELGVTKGYVSQLLNGDFDSRLSTVVNLLVKIGVIPELNLRSIEEVRFEIIERKKVKESSLSNPIITPASLDVFKQASMLLKENIRQLSGSIEKVEFGLNLNILKNNNTKAHSSYTIGNDSSQYIELQEKEGQYKQSA